MSEISFRIVPGTHLSANELEVASRLLSQVYTRWQVDPRNIDPAAVETSPESYVKELRSPNREVCLGEEDGQLRAVFVHSLSPQFDQVPVRKLSYGAIVPSRQGFGEFTSIAARYAAFVREQGEDIVAAIDPEQTTLEALLLHAGFREIVDRNEIYFLLSRLLRRQIISSHRVHGDFVVDEIIELNGKSICRGKKLCLLQTSRFDAWATYRQQQLNRLERSIPPENLALLREALRACGIFVVSDFDGTITLEDESQGGFDSTRLVMGPLVASVVGEIFDAANSLIYLVPGTEEELRSIANRVVWRPGFFDFLCFCFKALGSFFVTSAATPYQVRYALERALGPDIPIRYVDLVEEVLTPAAELVPGLVKLTSDGALRAAYRFSGPYVDLSRGQYDVKKELMIDRILGLKGDTTPPLLYLGNDLRDAPAVSRLYAESAARSLPVLVFDFGTELTLWAHTELVNRAPAPNRFFSMVGVRDFYQIPVMLAEMGLELEPGIEFTLAD